MSNLFQKYGEYHILQTDYNIDFKKVWEQSRSKKKKSRPPKKKKGGIADLLEDDPEPTFYDKYQEFIKLL